MSGDTWCTRYRQKWIDEMLKVYGFINRKHIERMFEISSQQASADLQTFLKEHPGRMFYSASRKQYEVQP